MNGTPIHSPNVFIADRTDTACYRLQHAFESNAKRIFIVGPNLLSVATTEPLKSKMANFLERDGRRVEILISDLQSRKTVNTWDVALAAGGKWSHREHLKKSTHAFQELRKIHGNRLDVRVAPHVPLSAYVVDPDGEDPILVLTPIIYGGGKSIDRPQVILRRSQCPGAYQYYWSNLYSVAFTILARPIDDKTSSTGAIEKFSGAAGTFFGKLFKAFLPSPKGHP